MAGGTRKARIRPLAPVPIHRPTTEIVVTPKHSFEMVRTVMTATLSHVLWARKVFPNVDYEFRTYDPADPSVDYEDFMNGKKSKQVTFDPTEGLYIWKVMPRGKDPGIDKMLNRLEVGATDALEKGYLHKLQLTFHSMDNNPASEANVIESYTLIFAYEVNKGITVSSEIESGCVVLRSAKEGFNKMVSEVSALICNFNKHRAEYKNLPDQFRMVLSLQYYLHTPADYQPPGFYQGSHHTARLLSLKDSPEDELTTMATGHHRVCVDAQAYDIVNNDPLTPRQTPHQQVLSPSSASGGSHTQPEAMKVIGGIGASRDPDRGTQDTVLLQRTRSTQQPSAQGIEVQSEPFSFPPYTQSIIDRVEAARAHRALKGKSTVSKRIRLSEHPLNCECEVNKTNEDQTEELLQCALCRERKHIICYGYLNRAIPQAIVCYTCLLDEEDPDRLAKTMKPLCVKRRALHFLREREYLSAASQDDDFGAHLNFTTKQTSELLNKLKGEGYVKGHRHKAKSDPAPVYTYVNDEEKLFKDYFRPERGLDHLFALPKSAAPAESGFEENSPISVRRTSSLASTKRRPLLIATAVSNLLRAASADVESSSTQGTPSPRGPPRKRSAEESLEEMSPKQTRVGNASPWLARRGTHE